MNAYNKKCMSYIPQGFFKPADLACMDIDNHMAELDSDLEGEVDDDSTFGQSEYEHDEYEVPPPPPSMNKPRLCSE